jgi:hypothetical protein
MGYAQAFGRCVNCGKFFGFNPHLVPSIRIDGERCPVCRECIERANPIRKQKGMDLIEIQPGAYEPMPEMDL